MIIKIIDLIKNKKIKIENIKNQQIKKNNNLIIQTGIGDLLLIISLLKAQVLKGPLYININIYIKNPYQYNNILDTLKFKLQLIEKTDTINDIIYFYDDNIEYSRTSWEPNIKFLNTFILQKYFTFNKLEQEYIIFHTKCRFYKNFDYNKLKQDLKFFFEQYKSKYKIYILGERCMPDNIESKIVNITTIYDELLLLKNNNDVLDLSIENIYDNLNFENYLQDISLIHNAKTNIMVGIGGSFCSCLVFANNLITYIDDKLFNDPLLLNFNRFQIDNKYICNSFETYLNYINVQGENNSSVNCYFLGHLGLGDNITNSSAVNYLLQYYNTIYFLCKDNYEENVKLLFQNKRIITIPVKSIEDATNIINSNINNDRFISGFDYPSLETKTFLKFNDKIVYEIDFQHIEKFYKDNQLSLSVYYNYFNIPPSEVDITLLLNYKIIFLHTQGSNRQIDLTIIINTYKFNENYILICANQNVYNPSEQHYLLANKYVNLLVCNYIDIIKNANLIYVIDSCFSCIVYPLMKMDKLKAEEVIIYKIQNKTFKKKIILSNFNWKHYIANHPNLKKKGINNKIKAFKHYTFWGKKQNITIKTRIITEITNFNWKQYISNYPNLKKLGINNKIKALKHYKLWGKKQNRTFKKLT